MEDRVLTRENWSEMFSNIPAVAQINIVGHIARPLHRKKPYSVGNAKTEEIFILSSAYFFVCTSQWLPVTSKKICKWVLCLVVIKSYYGNLRAMSVTWNIGVFIAFKIAVTMVRYSGSLTNFFYWISSVTFWKAGSRRPIASEFPLTWSFIRKKLHHMRVLSTTKPHLHHRLHTSISKVVPCIDT